MLPKTKEFLTKEIPINSYLTDYNGNLSLPSLFLLFQELAWEHATLNGFGYIHLKEQGFFWALSRLRVVIEKMPKWTDEIKITTWPSGIEGPFALRDFKVFNSQDEILIGATTSWLIVDTETRRPKRPDTFKDKMPISDSNRATEGNAEKIKIEDGDSISEYNLTSKISDLDINGHVNNAKYIEWAVNSFSKDNYMKLDLKEVNVNFLSEGFCEQDIEVKTSKKNSSNFFSSIKRANDNRNLAYVEFISRL